MRAVFIALSLVFANLAMPRGAAATGEIESWRPDTGFGANSVASVSMGTKLLTGYTRLILTQPGGHAVVVSRRMIRLRPDGSPDASFGSNGTLQPSIDDFVAGFTASLTDIDTTGRFVAALQKSVDIRCSPTDGQTCANRVASRIARFTADGQPDSTFGLNGVSTMVFDNLETLEMLHDGSVGLTLLIRNGACGQNPTLAYSRLLSNGTLDTSIGVGGFQALCGLGNAKQLVELSNHKLLLYMNFPVSRYGYFARLNADGTLDTSYGTLGVVAIGAAEREPLIGDGAAFVFIGSGLIRRISPSGQLDAIALPAGVTNDALPLLIYPDGEMLVEDFGQGQNLLKRITGAGNLDTSFGAIGVYTLTTFIQRGQVARFSDNALLLSQYAAGQPIYLKLSASGSPVAAYGNNGFATPAVSIEATGCATEVATQSTGKHVVAGDIDTTPTLQKALARFAADGQLDASFGLSGTLIANVAAHARMIVRSDDRIALFDGKTLAVLGANGAPDPGFGLGAAGAISVTQPMSAPFWLGADASGRLLVAGTWPVQPDALISRYTSTGTLDSSFGTGGSLRLANARLLPGFVPDRSFWWEDVPAGYIADDFRPVESLSVQPDGTLNALLVYTDSVPAAKLLQWSPDGMPDPAFGVSGAFTLPIYVNGLFSTDLQHVAGGAWLIASTTPVSGTTVVRVTPGGQLDTTYGNAGIATRDFNDTPFFTDDAGRAYLHVDGNIERLSSDGNTDGTLGLNGQNLAAMPFPSNVRYTGGTTPTLMAPLAPPLGCGKLSVQKLTLQHFTPIRINLPMVAGGPPVR